MTPSHNRLRQDAIQIWQAGLEAVRSDRLVHNFVRVESDVLTIGDDSIKLSDIRRILVVGAGKAGAGMAAGLEQALGEQLLASKQVVGWVNVADDCVRQLKAIHLHGARPAGINEPTTAGVVGAAEIRRLVESASHEDLCIVLISGGASALLPDPIDGVLLTDKLAITRFLSSAGANIEQLNMVRKQLSRLKGGGLARACRAGHLYALIISDVLGDPLDVIGSGLTACNSTTIDDALAVLDEFKAAAAGVAPDAVALLQRRRKDVAIPKSSTEVHNLIIGNNAVAVDAAGLEAERRGYSHAMVSATKSEGFAEDVGRHLATMAVHMRNHAGPNCLISGGEPVVRLAPVAERGRGGRNQQLVLAAMQQLEDVGGERIAILSAGTDGEDGPTDAAGAVCDDEILQEAGRLNLDLESYLKRNDAYTFFENLGGLIKTGPTHTNVCDLRVVTVDQSPDL
jgi:glycerate 2-kinase